VLTSFANQEGELLAAHPDAKEEISHIHTALVTIGRLIRTSPRVNGNGAVWKELAEKAEVERPVLCKHLDGKALYTAILRLSALTNREMRESWQDSEEEPAQRNEEFRQQKRRNWTPSDEKEQKMTKTTTAAPGSRDPRIRSKDELPTRNFFAPLRTYDMDMESRVIEEATEKPDEEPQQKAPSQSGTSTVNLIHFQKH
jgi:hypothetical protein